MISEKQLGTSYPSIQHFMWCFLLTFGNSLWQCCSGMRRVWRLEGDRICLWIHILSSAPRYRIPPGDDGEWSCGQEHGPIMESQGTASSAAQSEIIDKYCGIIFLGGHYLWIVNILKVHFDVISWILLHSIIKKMCFIYFWGVMLIYG